MRNNLPGLLAVAVLLFGAVDASAQSWYAGGYGGLNYTHDASTSSGDRIDHDFIGLGIGGFVGYVLPSGLRVEGEIIYRASDVDTVNGAAVTDEISSTAFMANAFYDFSPQSSFTPYAGGGIGFASVDYETGGNVYNDVGLAIQLGAGVLFDISETLTMSVDYRLFGTQDLSFGAGLGMGNVEYLTSAILVGLRTSF